MFNKSQNKYQQGSTLIEVLVAILIMAIVLTGLATALTYSLKNSAQADYRQVATRQAQDVIEILRKERSRLGWSGFEAAINTNSGTYYCVGTSATGFSNFTTDSSSPFCPNNVAIAQSPITMSRYFHRTNGVSDSRVTVEVIVTWPEGTATRTVNLVQDFRDIN